MAWTKEDACAALRKGWKKRGLSGERLERAHAKCLRNYKAPRRRRHRSK